MEIIERAMIHRVAVQKVDKNLMLAWCMNMKGTDAYELSLCMVHIAGCDEAAHSKSRDEAERKNWEKRRDEHIATYRGLKQVEITLP